MLKNLGPNPNDIYTNANIKTICFIKNTIKNSNIEVGDYYYYYFSGEGFEKHVTHHYEFIGDKLVIGKFCAIASGANHRMNSVTTYPFNIMGNG